VLEQIRSAEKVGLFTSEEHSPAVVARALLDQRIDYFTAYVCENLGAPDERVTRGELAEIAAQEFASLNVMILVRKPHVPDRPSESIGRRLFGNPDEEFLQSRPKRGLLTPAELRSMALAELDLGPTSTVWDIGAGSGSVAIEAAQIACGGTVYAMMYGKPAGKYRIRVTAVGRDAVIDAVDIRPAMDVGVGVCQRVVPWAYYKSGRISRITAPVLFIWRIFTAQKILQKKVPSLRKSLKVFLRKSGLNMITQGILNPGGLKVLA
ncbi:MAG: hypothetical protein NTY71_08150, partial [Methanoregula sp.]|nr:hypothetical protein [Methanoregula sp.]